MQPIELFGNYFNPIQVVLLALLSVALIIFIYILIRVLMRLHKLNKYYKEIEAYGKSVEEEDEQEEETLDTDNDDDDIEEAEVNTEIEDNIIVDLHDNVALEETKTPCPRRFTLRLRLNNATTNLKSRYSRIRNFLESYKVREQFLKHRDNYFIMKENIQKSEDGSVANKCSAFKLAMLTIRRKTLILSLNIDRDLTIEEQNDNIVIDTRRYRAYNYNMKVSTEADLNKALKLIEDLFALYSINKKKKHEDHDYVLDFSENLTAFERRGYGYLLKNEVSFEESDALSKSLSKNAVIINKVDEKPQNNYKCEVSLETIIQNFNDGDEVNINILKEKGIIKERYSKFIVTDAKFLNKRLFIDADGFSSNAIKMIFIAGGEARVIQRIS